MFQVQSRALNHDQGQGHHHAPEPFILSGELAKGKLAIVDTPAGERFRLTLTHHADGLAATVIISRKHDREVLPLRPVAGDHHLFESDVAPAEPHAFLAELQLAARAQQETLPFEMKEPEGHCH